MVENNENSFAHCSEGQVRDQGPGRAPFPPQVLGEKPSFPLLASGGCWHPLACLLFLPPSSRLRPFCAPAHALRLAFKDIRHGFGACLDYPEQSPPLKTFILPHPAKSQTRLHSQVPGIQTSAYFGRGGIFQSTILTALVGIYSREKEKKKSSEMLTLPANSSREREAQAGKKC